MHICKLAAVTVSLVLVLCAAAQAAGENLTGKWSAVNGLPLVPASGAVLPNGKLLLWAADSEFSFSSGAQARTVLVDPASLAQQRLNAYAGHNMFCTGTTLLEDGRVLVNGGSNAEVTSIFDPASNSFSRVQDMKIPRGYNANTILADGAVFTLGGSWSGTTGVDKAGEIWTQAAGWRLLPGVPTTGMTTVDPNSSFSGDSHYWLIPSGNGKVLYAGPSANMKWINTSGNGSVGEAGPRGDDGFAVSGTTVMYEAGKTLKAGGSDRYSGAAASRGTYLIDTTQGVSVSKLAPMTYPRGYHNSVVLPDGKVMMIGGQSFLTGFSDSDAVLATEIWDPSSRTFSVTAPIAVPRNYHSIALLLPDGRVLSGGGGLCACSADHPDFQVYSPPYLFDASGNAASRPSITGAPAELPYGTTVPVTTDRDVAAFSLVRLSTTTHTVNNDQRRLAVSFRKTGTNQYILDVASNAGYLLPGYWMLFALDGSGVPSVAKIVRVRPNTIARMVSPETISVAAGQPVSVQPQVEKIAANVTYGGSGLPAGVSVNPSTGLISGTPTVAGSYRGALTATDGTRTVSTDLHIYVEPAGGGSGLLGEYFATTNLTGSVVLQRTEALDASYTSAGPGGGVPGIFSARWSGKLVAMRTGTTRLRTVSDDGVRVWIDGQLVVDNWTNHAATANDGQVDLVAGRSYAVLVSYFNSGGPGEMRLQWQRPGDSSFTAVPAAQLLAASPVASGNVAQGKAASQSSLYAAGYVASNAVDGATGDGKYFHTLNGANEWWQVDLGSLQAIDRIRLWNRSDCCQNRLQNFHVLISASDLTGRSYSAILGDSSVARRTVGASTIDSTLDIPGGVTGRYVRVQMAGSQYLHLAEVQVSGRAANRAPTIATPPAQIGSVGAGANLAVSASDPDGDALSYAATGLPPGLAIGATTGLISGTLSGAGSFTPLVRVTDAGGLSASASFAWNVADIVPQVTALAVGPQPVGTEIFYVPQIANATGVTYSWNFGDGTAATAFAAAPSASHAFAAPGIYAVSLVMKNSSGSQFAHRFDQAVHPPVTAAGGGGSAGLAVETRVGASARLWVANRDNDSVAVIDTATNTRVAEIAVGREPVSVARHSSGAIWVVNRGSASLSIIDPTTLRVSRTVALPRGTRPGGLVFAGPAEDAYFTFEATGQLARARADGYLLGWVYAGKSPRAVTTNSDRTRLYVSGFITPPLPGEGTATVRTVDGAGKPVGGQVWDFSLDRTLQRRFVLQHSERTDTEVSARGIPNYLGAAVASPDGKSLWVPSKQDNVKRGTLRDGLGLNFQNSVRAIVSRIDLATGLEDIAARIDVDNSGLVSAIAFHPTGAYLFAALQTSREVAVLDPGFRRELFRFPVGRAPSALALSADGLTLYVSNFMDRTVSVVDLAALINRGQKAVTVKATVSTIATEKLAAAVLRGKQLFYDAADPRLARDGYISCAVCHENGESDGRTWDFTGFGEGLRNTISLAGHGGMAQGFLHWSANFDEIQDFEGQIRGFAGGSGLMTDADFNAGDRAQPLGARKAGLSADLDALAAYVSSRTMVPTSPFRNADGTLTAKAVAGKAVFTAAGCASCHAGTQMTISADAAALRDIGTINAASGKRLGGNLPGIDVPSLRGLWATAPYLHNGSQTIEGAIRAHRGVAIGDADLANLVRYLSEIEQAP